MHSTKTKPKFPTKSEAAALMKKSLTTMTTMADDDDDDDDDRAEVQPPIAVTMTNDNAAATGSDDDDDDDAIKTNTANKTSTTTTTATTTLPPEKKMKMMIKGVLVLPPKYQYYQNEKFMTIAILENGLNESTLDVNFEPERVTATYRGVVMIAGELCEPIDIDKSKIVYKPEKALIKLRKTSPFEWHDLFDDNKKIKKNIPKKNCDPTSNKTKDEGDVVKTGNDDDDDDGDDETKKKTKNDNIPMPLDDDGNKNSTKKMKNRPYASYRDWDAIERNIIEDEKNNTPQDMEGMLKQMFSSSNDDVRRAMVKSFQTSGGTALSTDWNDVKNRDYEKELNEKEHEGAEIKSF